MPIHKEFYGTKTFSMKHSHVNLKYIFSFDNIYFLLTMLVNCQCEYEESALYKSTQSCNPFWISVI